MYKRLILLCSVFAYFGFVYSIDCYDCSFKNVSENSLFNCTKASNCTTENACVTSMICKIFFKVWQKYNFYLVLDRNLNEKRYSAFCIFSKSFLKNVENPKPNGCWKLEENKDEEFCYCTTDYCNKLSPG